MVHSNNKNPVTNRIPLKGRSINHLLFSANFKHRSVQKRLQNIELARATKTSDLKDTSEELIFFKRNRPDHSATEFEAYCAALAQFLATSKYVPSVRAYYDEENNFVGVGAKELPGFIANADNPLTAQDLMIDSHKINTQHQRNILLRSIKKLIKDKSNLNFTEKAKDCYKTFFADDSQFKLRRTIVTFLTKPEFSAENLDVLLSILQERYYKIFNEVQTKEVILLDNAIRAIYELKRYEDNPRLVDFDIEDFEELSKVIEDEQLNLEECERFIELATFDKNRYFRTSDVKHYEALKGLAISLTTRYILKERDNNNTNMSKNGKMVDFGKTKENLHFDLRNNDLLSLLMQLNDQTFVCTERDIRNFPHVKDADLYYWPTMETKAANIIVEAVKRYLDDAANYDKSDDETKRFLIDLISNIGSTFYRSRNADQTFFDKLFEFTYLIVQGFKGLLSNRSFYEVISAEQQKNVFESIKLDFLNKLEQHKNIVDMIEYRLRESLNNQDNRFTARDNAVFKKLTTNPVFIFHKFKTFLKYILTDDSIYTLFAHAYINADTKIKGMDLRDTAIKDEVLRINEIKQVLLNMPEFAEFLREHGQLALRLIKEEMSLTRYQKLLDIDVDLIDKRYAEIYAEVCPAEANTFSLKM